MIPVTRALRLWPWLFNRLLSAWLLVMAALLLGVLALAAVAKIECRDEPQYALTVNGQPLMLEDGSGFLLRGANAVSFGNREPMPGAS
jgi:hypothetical protein